MLAKTIKAKYLCNQQTIMMDKHTKYYIKDKVYQIAAMRAESNGTTVRGERSKLVTELADAVGVTPNHIRKVWAYTLDEDAEARMEHLIAFGRVLGCSATELMNEELIEQLNAAKEYP